MIVIVIEKLFVQCIETVIVKCVIVIIANNYRLIVKCQCFQ